MYEYLSSTALTYKKVVSNANSIPGDFILRLKTECGVSFNLVWRIVQWTF